jgi:hypothetical protein
VKRFIYTRDALVFERSLDYSVPIPDRFYLQHYLRKCLTNNFTTTLSTFRVFTRAVNIKGRYTNITRIERKCQKCDLNEIEDDCHFVLSGPYYSNLRQIYIKQYYHSQPSMFKLVQRFTVRNKKKKM